MIAVIIVILLVLDIAYASWGPKLWPFLRSCARALTIKAVGIVATKGVFGN